MISLIDIFRLVLKYAFEKKGRVILTISGIIIGIFTFTFFIFLSQGLSNAITEQFTTFGTNVIAIQAATSASMTGPPSGGSLTKTDLEKVKQVIRGYKYVAPVIFFSGQYNYGRDKHSFTSLAYQDNIWPEVYLDIGINIEKGRFIRLGEKGVAVIGSKVVSAFGNNKKLNIGSVIKSNGKSLRIIGILKSKGDFMIDNAILTTFSDIKAISSQTTYTAIRVSFYENINITDMIARVDAKFNKPNKEKKVVISTPSQILEKFNTILGALTLIITFISSIALLVGGINVMNTMHSNVIERVNEISVLKALGAENRDILNIFLIESAILGLIGALIGFILSFSLAKFLSYIITNYAGYNVPVYFDITFFSLVILVTTLVATLFGTIPAISAAKINPSDNLRDD